MQVKNLCGQCDTVEPAYRYRSVIRLAPVACIFIRSVIINLTMLCNDALRNVGASKCTVDFFSN